MLIFFIIQAPTYRNLMWNTCTRGLPFANDDLFFFTMKISGILYNEMCIFDWLVINDCGQFDTNE